VSGRASTTEATWTAEKRKKRKMEVEGEGEGEEEEEDEDEVGLISVNRAMCEDIFRRYNIQCYLVYYTQFTVGNTA
jgi:hypothetical protein